MPALRVDWEAIKSATTEADVVVILPARVARVILATYHIYEWEATFRLPTYDFSDWDYLQRELSRAQECLGSPMLADDLLAAINAVTDAVNALDLKVDCCTSERTDFTGGLYYTDEVIEGALNGVPQNVVDAGYATDTNDWDGYHDYKCDMMAAVVDDMIRKLNATAQHKAYSSISISALGGIAGLLLIGGTAVPIIGGFIALVGLVAALEGLSALDVETMVDTMEDLRDELICTLYSANNADSAISAFESTLNTELGGSYGELTSAGYFIRDEIRAAFGARYDTTDLAEVLVSSSVSHDCSLCDTPLPEDERDAAWDFEDGTLGGWSQ